MYISGMITWVLRSYQPAKSSHSTLTVRYYQTQFCILKKQNSQRFRRFFAWQFSFLILIWFGHDGFLSSLPANQEKSLWLKNFNSDGHKKRGLPAWGRFGWLYVYLKWNTYANSRISKKLDKEKLDIVLYFKHCYIWEEFNFFYLFHCRKKICARSFNKR